MPTSQLKLHDSTNNGNESVPMTASKFPTNKQNDVIPKIFFGLSQNWEIFQITLLDAPIPEILHIKKGKVGVMIYS